ncbi:hypothetical protein BD324DRAFT_654632 [Kockovaella imperatae]|uniref:SEC7 domain-containing protein n=1 Tax=Kockovaella imperatae TaxID=4999 RepID=A0A1Y1USM8_9TREE|nr:hypothetical protein BD324DRAFT_654632 [Kockovaella imperatae]ORX41011.1 hypothetical protein BD324DRAFT_654632 [Kockovaella imperatae]
MEDAGAGPSSPRRRTSHEHVDRDRDIVQVQALPDTPGTTGGRRRSWFHFGGSSSRLVEPSVEAQRRRSADHERETLSSSLPTRGSWEEIMPGAPAGGKESTNGARRRGGRAGEESSDGGTLGFADMSLATRRRESQTTITHPVRDSRDSSPPASLSTTPQLASLETLESNIHHPSRESITPRPMIPARTSSYGDRVPNLLQLDESQPLTPTERPLPPIPLALLPVDSPTLPTDIVITPSSPTHHSDPSVLVAPEGISQTLLPQFSSPMTRNRSRSASPRPSPREIPSSDINPPIMDSTLPQKLTPIGLGRPGQAASQLNNDIPPPVPAKPVSVSTPVRLRAASPAQRIVFALPGEGTHQSGRSTPNAESQTRVRRARSLSGIWKESSSGAAAPIGSRPASPEPVYSESPLTDEMVVKASGVLGWLGIKKTVKRRQSEGKLPRIKTDPEKFSDELASGAKSLSRTSSRRPSQEPLKRPSVDEYSGSRQTSGATTVVPGSQSRIQSLFNRRASAQNEERESEGIPTIPNSPIVLPAQARPIPAAQRWIRGRPTTAESSQSSLQLEADSFSSSQIAEPETWVSTPDGEETLFDPEGSSHWGPGMRPWMDSYEQFRPGPSTPLDSLPEKEVLPTPSANLIPGSSLDHGSRARAWSDAPRPRGCDNDRNSSEVHLPSRSLQPSPFEGSRPKMPGRSSSGNAAIIGRMRSAFLRSSSRGKPGVESDKEDQIQSDELPGRIDTAEFGGRPSGDGIIMQQTLSSSSDVASSRPRSRRGMFQKNSGSNTLLGLLDGDRQILLNETPERSPRTSMTATSASSVASGSNRPPAAALLTGRSGRVRASTLSAAPSSSTFVSPVSPQLYPAAATPPRRRASAISRMTQNLLGTSPRGPTLFPLPPRSSGSLSSAYQSGLRSPDEPSSLVASPRPSAGSISAFMGNAALKAISARLDDETPEQFLERITRSVGGSDIGTVLASSADDFYRDALRLFMSRFDFTHNSLDVALRKLLLAMSLPKETQQIDRIIEAFSARYEECEPALFGTKDNTYILAFSMIMLHTDAFNRHNKNKMTKPDYVKNTRLDGVSSTVLEAFYDNITYTPFIFVDDDPTSRSAISSNLALDAYTPSSAGPSTPSGSMTLQTPRSSGKLDVYQLIGTGAMDSLRVDVERFVPVDSPFNCHGTRPSDADSLHNTFLKGALLPIISTKRKSSTASFIGNSSAGSTKREPDLVLRVTKAGLLSRKDEGPETGKKLSRKWKAWSVVLTGSQLLFFRDPTWALSILEQTQRTSGTVDEPTVLSTVVNFKPDEVFPVSQCIATYDESLDSSSNTFRYLMPPGRSYMLQAADENEMNEWINLINYASAFKTADIRMRSPPVQKEGAVQIGAEAAKQHQVEQSSAEPESAETGASQGPVKKVSFEGPAPTASPQFIRASSHTVSSPAAPRPIAIRAKSADARAMPAVDTSNEVMETSGEKLEKVLDVVKADLAAGSEPGDFITWKANMGSTDRRIGHRSRNVAVERQIHRFEAQLKHVKENLEVNLRLARNLAILTPFQKLTRDRIQSAVTILAQKVRQDRVHVAKVQCWIDVLREDLEQDERDWARIHQVALQAATRALREPELSGQRRASSSKSKSPEVPTGIRTSSDLPKFSLSSPEMDNKSLEHDHRSPQTPIRSIPVKTDTSHHSDLLGRSPGELPIVIRRSSEDGPLPVRPGYSRQVSANSYLSVDNDSSGNRESTQDEEEGDGKASKDTIGVNRDTRSATNASSPMLFSISDLGEAPKTR